MQIIFAIPVSANSILGLNTFSGPEILQYQKDMNYIRANRYSQLPYLVEDGLFGNQCSQAARIFQILTDLTEDGLVGNETKDMMVKVIADIKVGGKQQEKLTLTVTCSRYSGYEQEAFDFSAVTNRSVISVYAVYSGNSTRYYYNKTDSAGTRWSEVNGPYGVVSGNRIVTVTAVAADDSTATASVNIKVYGRNLQPPSSTSSGSDQRSKILEYAKSQVGQGNIYAEKFGASSSSAWCCYFVSYCAQKAGVSDSVFVKTGWCPTLMQFLKNQGVYYPRGSEYTPKAGDIIFFDWSGAGSDADHVGIITTVNGINITFIDGNSGSKYIVSYQTWATTNNSWVSGYASPKYS